MIGLFRGKLEPGETILWREPVKQLSWTFPLIYPGGLLVLHFLAEPLGLAGRNPDHFLVQFEITAIIFLPLWAIALLANRWKVAVTDRRVLRRDGFWRTGWAEMSRDAITEVVEDMPWVILRGEGREMRLTVGQEAHYLHALLTGTLEAATEVTLAEGETEMLRLPGRWRRWRIMVTDRRILYRSSFQPPRIEQMQLSEIEEVRRDIVFHAVVLRGGGREMSVRAGPAQTERLLEAFGQPSWNDLALAKG